MGGMWWSWLFGIMLLLGVTMLVVLVVLVLRSLNARSPGGSARTNAQPTGRSPARAILDERYARGELTAEEYRERLQVLGHDT